MYKLRPQPDLLTIYRFSELSTDFASVFASLSSGQVPDGQGFDAVMPIIFSGASYFRWKFSKKKKRTDIDKDRAGVLVNGLAVAQLCQVCSVVRKLLQRSLQHFNIK